MSDLPREKPASFVAPGIRIDYWKDVRRADGSQWRAAANEDTADFVDVSAGPLTETIKLAWIPDNQVIVATMITIASKAYASGAWDAKAELREWLGVH